MFLKSNKKYIQVKTNAILFIEATGNYINVVTEDDEIQVREKLAEVLQLLPESQFVQTHKSFIVSKQHIKQIEGNRISIKSYIIPIGKVYKKNIEALLQ